MARQSLTAGKSLPLSLTSNVTKGHLPKFIVSIIVLMGKTAMDKESY
jgi:hypothetical protein